VDLRKRLKKQKVVENITRAFIINIFIKKEDVAIEYSMHGEMREARKPEGKKPLARPRCRWKSNINRSKRSGLCLCRLDLSGPD
jgi:hypothetical protein